MVEVKEKKKIIKREYCQIILEVVFAFTSAKRERERERERERGEEGSGYEEETRRKLRGYQQEEVGALAQHVHPRPLFIYRENKM